MAWTKLTPASPGAPAGVRAANGSLNDLLRWALPALGWSVEYGPTGNASVFRANAGTNRLRLHVRHESSVSGSIGLAYVRGCHTATSATAIGQPFPTASQVANNSSNWCVGDTGNPTVDRRFVIYGNDRFFILLIDTANGWEISYFGEVPSTYPTIYDTIIAVRGNVSPDIPTLMQNPIYAYVQPDYIHYYARGINGTTISTLANRIGSANGSASSQISQMPTFRGGFQNRILREKIALGCSGATNGSIAALCMLKRSWIPNLYALQCNGITGINDLDTFTDTVYNPAATFIIYKSYSHAIVIEETDTWHIPT